MTVSGSGFAVHCDYLKFTLPSVERKLVLDLFPGVFVEGETSAYGYRIMYLQKQADGGTISIFTGKNKAPNEVYVVCSGSVVSTWSYDFLRAICTFVNDRKGTSSRFDIAFDDFSARVSVSEVAECVVKGQAVKRSKDSQHIKGLHDNAALRGETLSIGSRVSETFIRIYNKVAEQVRKHGKCEKTEWVRWELELKGKRSTKVMQCVPHMSFEDFREFSVGLLRGAVDFRDCSIEDDRNTRARAALLPWWEELTEGFKRATLGVRKIVGKIQDAMMWFQQAVAPIAAVLAAHPLAGDEWITKAIVNGADRWRQRHYDLLQRAMRKSYVLRPRFA